MIFFLQGRTLLGHDYVFWCGDFNYRVNMCREDVLHCVKNKDWETLLSADQLKVKISNFRSHFGHCELTKLNVDSYFQIEKENGNVFDDFNEGEIDFAPTYKYVRTHHMFSRILNFSIVIGFFERKYCRFDKYK